MGRPFANLIEWGQQFIASLGPLEMLGAFLLVFTPNKKQFPLLKGFFFWLDDEWLGGFCLAWNFNMERTSCFKAETLGTEKTVVIQVTESDKGKK